MPTILAIETSCDETSAAVVKNGVVLANVVSSQIQIHAEYGGVVPELAAREHLKNLPAVVRATLDKSGCAAAELTAIAATRGPGLPSALMAGLKMAQGMAFTLGIPFIGVHHHEAHLYSPWIGGNPPSQLFFAFEPNVSLIVSGGHTMLVLVKSELEHQLLGGTLDDAAGECFDKCAKLMGLPYPGGPEMDRLGSKGNPEAFCFPRPMMNDDSFDFSFSGLKTSVRIFIRKNPEVLQNPHLLCNLCASVQAAIIETLVNKTIRAAIKCRVNCITGSGGVICNSSLRKTLAQVCHQKRFNLRLADHCYCTDNAAMVGVLAERKLLLNKGLEKLDSDISPGWEINSIG